MKNIDFTDFFNVFLSGATISGVALYFIILYGKYVRYPIGVLKNTDVTLIPVSGEPA